MPKEYNNPPVVEAWIDFHFEYGEEASEWNDKVAVDYVNSFEPFKKEEHIALVKKEIKISKHGPVFSESAPVLQRLKTFNKTKDRCLQIEQNLLVYNLLRKKETKWPGFSVLLDEALPFCQSFIDAFHPVRLRTVLHYRDHVIIPFEENKIEPKDYFEIYPKMPEQFGNMIDYSLSLVLADICANGVARFSVRTEPSIGEKMRPQLPFILDWDVQSIISFECETLDNCGAWLELAHQGINKAFEGCLTVKCRSLFE
jgi:uncharacterized protein (TIGR04255 family)